MRGLVARWVGITAAVASFATAAPLFAAGARYEDGLAAYRRNDFDTALKTLKPLAEAGDARAQYMLGRHFQFGQGTKADRSEAYYWYRRAEAKGHLEARLFRQLLEKRWKISAADKARAEQRLAALKQPKPQAKAVAKVEPKVPPKKPIVAAVAKPPAVRPAAAEAKAPPLSRVPPETATRFATRDEAVARTPPFSPAQIRERLAAAPPSRDTYADDGADDADAYAPPTDPPPPAAVRTPMAPPPGYDYPPPGYAPPAYTPGYPQAYGPPGYYAPAAPPSWRAPYYAPPPPRYGPPRWGYRLPRAYVGWQRGWRGARNFRYHRRGF